LDGGAARHPTVSRDGIFSRLVAATSTLVAAATYTVGYDINLSYTSTGSATVARAIVPPITDPTILYARSLVAEVSEDHLDAIGQAGTLTVKI